MSRLVSRWDRTSDSRSDPGAGSDIIPVNSAAARGQGITLPPTGTT